MILTYDLPQSNGLNCIQNKKMFECFRCLRIKLNIYKLTNLGAFLNIYADFKDLKYSNGCIIFYIKYVQNILLNFIDSSKNRTPF